VEARIDLLMMRRSPARFLAPIALVAFAFALYSIIQDSRDSTTNSGAAQPTATSTPTSKSSSKKKSSKKRRTYTVKSGDTLSGIAEKTGVSLETLNDLNPDADTLSPGQKLRLRR